MVTNLNWDGEEIIHWLHERCGKSEEVHAVMKSELLINARKKIAMLQPAGIG